MPQHDIKLTALSRGRAAPDATIGKDPGVDRYDRLIERARRGDLVRIDGATGSEVIRRGVPEHELGWSGAAALTHPEIVRAVHDDYLRLGADLIASCTFAAGRNVMDDVGRGHQFEDVNRIAVELAVAARDASRRDDVVVAGGVSNWSFSGDHPPLDRLREDTVRQAEIMRDAGADLISLEMMVDIDRMTATLDAVTTVGLPIWVGFSIGPEEGHDASELADPIPLRDADLLVDAVDVARDHGADVLCLMHTDTRLIEPGLRAMRTRWDGPLGAYAHAAIVVDGQFPSFDDAITPDDYAAFVPIWRAVGATLIGGCCGIGPDHMHAVNAVLAD
ncbi:MAG: homocysteine S-methyltransferase family protein [Actinomycetota bacterium]